MNRIKHNVHIDEDLAYLCGVLSGDGHIRHRKEKHDYLIKCVGNPNNEIGYYDNVIKPLFSRVFDLSIKTRLYDQNTTYGFQLYSKELYQFLTIVIGIPSGKKAESIRIPEIFKGEK